MRKTAHIPGDDSKFVVVGAAESQKQEQKGGGGDGDSSDESGEGGQKRRALYQRLYCSAHLCPQPFRFSVRAV